MNSGCICCSLVGDFGKALAKVLETYHPDRILIEPSGVGKLSDVIRAVQDLHADVELAGFVTVADVNKVRLYMKNFGEFYNNQIENASAILLSRTQDADPAKLDRAVAMIRERNPARSIVTTPVGPVDRRAAAGRDGAEKQLAGRAAGAGERERRARARTRAPSRTRRGLHVRRPVRTSMNTSTITNTARACTCEACAHEHEHEHGHHHEHEHEHEHHHEHGEGCTCEACAHEHGHEHHHGHHHADEVFTSWGLETHKPTTPEAVRAALAALDSGRIRPGAARQGHRARGRRQRGCTLITCPARRTCAPARPTTRAACASSARSSTRRSWPRCSHRRCAHDPRSICSSVFWTRAKPALCRRPSPTRTSTPAKRR